MTPRFQFQQPPAPRDDQIMRRASELKLTLYRDRDGDLHGDVEIRCGIGFFGSDGEDFDGSKQREALRFVRELLCAFEQRRPDLGEE